MILLRLFWEFFKAGLFAVGGGLATLPFLQQISAETGWFTTGQLADMVAVSECTPGPIGINMATYVGFTVGGIPGAVIATLGLITPSILVILIVARILKAFADSKYVKAVFYGLRAASTGLIAAACVSVAKTSLLNADTFTGLSSLLSSIQWKAVTLAVVLWLLTNLGTTRKGRKSKALAGLAKLHPAVFLAFSAAVGIVFSFAGV